MISEFEWMHFSVFAVEVGAIDLQRFISEKTDLSAIKFCRDESTEKSEAYDREVWAWKDNWGGHICKSEIRKEHWDGAACGDQDSWQR